MPSLDDARILHRAAGRMDGAIGGVIQLCILTLSTQWQVLAMDLGGIDWRRGSVRVPARGIRRSRIIPLSSAALQVLLRINGSVEGRGQAVTAGRGEPMRASAVRLDRVRTAMKQVMPATEGIRWNFQGLQRLGAASLVRDGATSHDVKELLGFLTPDDATRFPAGDRNPRLNALAERWANMVLAAPARPPG